MRDYAKVSPTFWTGETGRVIVQAGPDAIACACYLMTSPHSNSIGLYYLPLPYIGFDLALSEARTRAALKVCIDAGFCAYDRSSAFVWVYKMAHYQTAEALEEKDNRRKAVLKLYSSLPNNPHLGPFFERYGKAYILPRKRGGGQVSEGLGTQKPTIDNPSEGVPPSEHTPYEGVQASEQAPLKGGQTSEKAPSKPGTGTGAETEERKTSSAADADRLASLLLDLIREHNPTHKQPNLKRWAQDLGRAIRIDGRTPLQLEAVIRFAQGDDFWCSNILSGEKVRDKFDQLAMKMKAKGGRSGKRALLRPTTYAQAKHADRQANVELVERIINAESNGDAAGYPGGPGKTEPDLLPS